MTPDSHPSNTGERMAILETKVDTIIVKLNSIEKQMGTNADNFVSRREFQFLQNIVYTGLGIVLTTILVFLVNKFILNV